MKQAQNNRPSFLLYKSFYPAIKHLTNEELGLLFRALFEYQDGSEIIKLSPEVGMAFAFFKNQFTLDEQKYQTIVERNKSNGSRGGRPKKEETQISPENPLGYLEPKKAEKEKEKEKETEKEIEKDLKIKKEIILIPDFIDAEIWNGFLEMRKKQKAYPTETAIKSILSKLTAFENKKIGNANESLTNSLENAWKGVFEPRQVQSSFANKAEQQLQQNVATSVEFLKRVRSDAN